jgi:amino acid adenylation domain-containing protein
VLTEDAGLAAVVARQVHAGQLSTANIPVMFVEPAPESDGRDDGNPEIAVAPTDLVYVLYTSGTTGRPKGVLIEHRHLLQYVWAVVDRLELRAEGSYAMVQPLTVDSSQTMIFPSLGRGGTLHMISDERALDGAGLAEYFSRHRVDYLKIAPSHLAALLDRMPSAALLPGHALIIGGEASPWAFIERIRALGPRCTLWNHYGPTETTVGTSVCRLDPGHSLASVAAPIGRPLPNVRYYVLDQHRQLVPFGARGELFIGGHQVARGYLNRPELTADRFVPDPFGDGPDARLYASGDQVRYLPDGQIEFLGRNDHQVKILGFRVEPGEIEAALRTVTGVRAAAVTATADSAGGKRLLAFVVPERGVAL